jgi:serine/threonine protein kinase KIN1/2
MCKILLISDCKSLLSKILVVDVSKRATFAEIAQHPWMHKGGEGPIENYFPTRLPLTLPLDDEVIRGMKGFEFGTEEQIRQHLTSIVQSSAYLKACEQYQKLLEAATSSAIAEKSEKRKAFSLEFYKRKSTVSTSSWSENGVTSATSLQFDDPTNAFDPLLSVYYLVREKQERDRQSSEMLTRSNTGLVSPKAERSLRLPSIPLPEAVHTSEQTYEIATPPDNVTRRSPSFRSRARSRGDEDFAGLLPATSLSESVPPSPRSKILDDLAGGKGGSLLRRISTKWSREPIKDSKKDSKTAPALSTSAPVDITTPSRTLPNRKSREIDPFSPSSPAKPSIPPPAKASGLGRSTSISEADYRRRHAAAFSDDESTTRRRNDWPSSPQTPLSALSTKSAPGGRTRSVGHARHATISAARRANERQDRDFWSGPLAGASTIPEEMDPSQDRAAAKEDQFSRPVHLKGLFSVATTSTKPVQTMRNDLIRVFDHLGITHDEIKGGFFCIHRPSIALDTVQEPIPHAEEFSSGKKTRRRLSFGAPIAAAAQFAGFGSSEKRVRHENGSDASAESVPELHVRADLSGPGNAMIVQFEIYIVKFPWLSLHGIQFKRVGGDVWQYKNACVKILSELNW